MEKQLNLWQNIKSLFNANKIENIREKRQERLFKQIEERYTISKNEYPGNIFILCEDKDILKHNFTDIYFDIKLNDDGSDFDVISTHATINEYKKSFIRNGINDLQIKDFQKEAEKKFKKKLSPVFNEIKNSKKLPKFNIDLNELAKKDLLEYQNKEVESIKELKKVMKKIGYKDTVEFEYNGYNTLKVDDGDLEMFIINDSEEKIDILAIREYQRNEELEIVNDDWLSREEINKYEANLIKKYKDILKNENNKNPDFEQNSLKTNEKEGIASQIKRLKEEKLKISVKSTEQSKIIEDER